MLASEDERGQLRGPFGPILNLSVLELILARGILYIYIYIVSDANVSSRNSLTDTPRSNV